MGTKQQGKRAPNVNLTSSKAKGTVDTTGMTEEQARAARERAKLEKKAWNIAEGLMGFLFSDPNIIETLTNHENSHVLFRHRGLTDVEMCDRSIRMFIDKQDRRRRGTDKNVRLIANTSRYDNAEKEREGMMECLLSNTDKIALWLCGQPNTNTLDIYSDVSDEPYGRGIFTSQTTMQYRTGYRATTVLCRTPPTNENVYGFYAVSSFPDIDTPSASKLDKAKTARIPSMVGQTTTYRQMPDEQRMEFAVRSGITRPGRELPPLPPLDPRNRLMLQVEI